MQNKHLQPKKDFDYLKYAQAQYFQIKLRLFCQNNWQPMDSLLKIKKTKGTDLKTHVPFVQFILLVIILFTRLCVFLQTKQFQYFFLIFYRYNLNKYCVLQNDSVYRY